jgi:hypothetical protein
MTYSAEQADELARELEAMLTKGHIRLDEIQTVEAAIAALSQQAAPGVAGDDAVSAFNLWWDTARARVQDGRYDAREAAWQAWLRATLLASQPHPTGDTQEHTLIVEHACLHQALEELVRLKDLKDGWGKTDEYERAQPLAWHAARDVLRTLEETENLAMLMLRVSKGQTKAVTVPRDIAERWYAKFAADLAGDTQQEAIYQANRTGAWEDISKETYEETGFAKRIVFTHPPEATALAQQVKDAAIAAAVKTIKDETRAGAAVVRKPLWQRVEQALSAIPVDDYQPREVSSLPESRPKDTPDYASMVVMEFNEERVPQFSQGFQNHELLSVVSAERCAELVELIDKQAARVAMAWKMAAEEIERRQGVEGFYSNAVLTPTECAEIVRSLTPPDAQAALEELLVDAVKRGMAFEEANHAAGTGTLDADAREIVATLNQQKD